MPKVFGEGHKYIQIDVDIHDNDKIDILREKFDDAGFTFWVLFICRVFDNSYYIELTDRFVTKFCKKILKKPTDDFFAMVEFSIDIKLFNRKLYTDYNILTSRGIQSRYLFMSRNRERIKFFKEYMLEDVDYHNSVIVQYNREGQYLGHKKKQGEFTTEPFNKRDHVKKDGNEAEKPSDGLQPSKRFDDALPYTPEEIKPDHVRDPILEEKAAQFFGYNEISKPTQVILFSHFITALNNRGDLDEFRLQFPAYIQYKDLSGSYKHNFETFIGDQSQRFDNGAWKKENWEQKLTEELKKSHKKNGKTHSRGYTPENGYGQI